MDHRAGTDSSGRWQRRLRRLIRPVSSNVGRFRRTVAAAIDSKALLIRWPTGRASLNWGDKLNPALAKTIAGRRVYNSRELHNFRGRPVYSVIGSSLSFIESPDIIVWGTGFIAFEAEPSVRYKHIRAVRGPMSREKLLAAGIACPEVYGDPALLCPRYFPAERQPTYRLGLIPQWRDKELPWVARFGSHPDVHVIDIQGGIQEVIDEINRCQVVASSSLHGLVAADAYGVPSLWLRLSENPKGDWFKFLDYFASIGKQVSQPFSPDDRSTPEDMIAAASEPVLDIDLDLLLESCPFARDKA